MPNVRAYRMTLSTRGYDPGRHGWSFEAHFIAALPGDIRDVREDLSDYGVTYFIREVRRLYGVSLSERNVRIGFEREEPALSASRDIRIEFRELTFRGKQQRARAFPAEVLSYDPEAVDDERSEGYEYDAYEGGYDEDSEDEDDFEDER